MIKIYFRSEGLWMRAIDELAGTEVIFSFAVHREYMLGGFSVMVHL